MPIFRPKSNIITKVFLCGTFIGVVGFALFCWGWKWSLFFTETGNYKEQVVPFSHQHHVGGLGIDCRYCHTSVETSSNAGFPATHTCMSCHSQIWTNAAMLEPIRKSYEENRPLVWNKVYNLPDYVYFNHSIHVAKGVGCTTCHGQIDRMPLTTKVQAFYMQQCLECHKNPQKYLRPEDQVFNVNWHPPLDPKEAEKQGWELVRRFGIPPIHDLTDCYVCHR